MSNSFFYLSKGSYLNNILMTILKNFFQFANLLPRDNYEHKTINIGNNFFTQSKCCKERDFAISSRLLEVVVINTKAFLLVADIYFLTTFCYTP